MSYSTKKSAQSAARKQYGANYAHHADIAPVGEKWEIVAKVDYKNADSNMLPEPAAEVIVPAEIHAPIGVEVPAEFVAAMAEIVPAEIHAPIGVEVPAEFVAAMAEL